MRPLPRGRGRPAVRSITMRRVLVVKPSSLGDILHAFPAASLLAEAHPGLKIDWLVHPAFAKLLEYHPAVDRALLFDRSRLGRALSFAPAFASLVKELRKERYDAVIDLQGLMRSAAIGFLAKAPRRAGSAKPKEPLARLFYSESILPDPALSHAAERNCSIVCSFLGIPFKSPDFEMRQIPANREGALKALAAAGLGSSAPLVGIAPGARWDTKRWPPEFFASMAAEIARRRPGACFAVIGARQDSQLASALMAAAGEEAKVIDLTGRTGIGELVELVRLCELFICNDSGPMHIAAAVGTPLVALFGPTDPSLTGPHTRKALVLQPDLDCIKCLKRYCQKGLCHLSLDPAESASSALEFMHWRS